MWEDEGAWNSYASNDSYDWSGADWYNDGGGSWGNSADWYSEPSGGSGWEQSYAPSTYYPESKGNWQTNYTYEPKYSPGATSNPYAAQITSGNPSPEQMYARMGGDQGPEAAMRGFHFYRNQPGYQNDPALVEGEHYATSKYNLSNPLLNTTGIPQLVTLAGPPSYDALKFLAQNAPEWMRQYLPQFLTNASAPTFRSTWAGMKPLFGR